MSESHAISALKRKRAELAGELLELDSQRRALASKIKSVDQTMKLMGFAGDPGEIPAHRKRGWIFRRGQLRRMVLAALREAAGAPITNGEIAASVIQQMGWDADDDELHGLITGKVKDVRKRFNRLTCGAAETGR